MEEKTRRIKKAIDFAVRFGGIDGAHHKDWVIDQMVRALTGCKQNESDELEASDEYNELVKDACNGKDGPNTYTWEEGIAP